MRHSRLVGSLWGRLPYLVILCAVGGLIAPLSAGAHSSRRTLEIRHVEFRGTPRDPEIVIYGRHFGRRPEPSPQRGTSNLGNCGPIPGHTGSDYGDRLWLEDRTADWSAGYAGYVDCIGLIIRKYSDDEIAFRFGSLYGQSFGQPNPLGGTYGLRAGDDVGVTVRGVVFETHVHFPRDRERSHGSGGDRRH